jgi:NAD(P)-dependent dehydrogenase (short-subunit alcohol dehydrogenase family)
MSASFAGQTAVVTGASSGIGHAIAHALGAGGARLCLVGRRCPAALEGAGSNAGVLSYTADLAIESEIRACAEALRREVGPIDILVHSAGVIASGAIAITPVEELDRQYRVNLRAPYLLTQCLLPLLKPRQGQIVFINSSIYQNARALVGPYAATKYALKALADSLRSEVNPRGLRVLSIFPGRTASPMQAAVHADEGRSYQPERLLQPADVAAAVVQALALPRTAEVTDIHIRPLQNTGA